MRIVKIQCIAHMFVLFLSVKLYLSFIGNTGARPVLVPIQKKIEVKKKKKKKKTNII
jgi:hypothetical protein